MRHSPEKIDKIIAAVRRHNEPGYWINDLGALNRVYLALKDLRPLCIPGMDWTDDMGIEFLRVADEALADAEGKEAENDETV